MAVTVERLLAVPSLGLRSIVDGDDVAVSWVHSSDLMDPTPFLAEGQVLLTTASQFSSTTSTEEFEAYAERLSAVGLAALGIGTDVAWPAPPGPLIEACRRRGLRVFDVPYRVPFLALARWVADELTAEATARDAWSVKAQRTISLAALSPRRLDGVLEELARQLSGRVLLFDGHGDLVGRFGAARPLEVEESEVQREANRMLRRNTRSGGAMTGPGWAVALQTLGRRDQLRGVLGTVTVEPVDSAANAVITGAVALTEFALEDTARNRAQQAALNDQLLHLVLEGEVLAVERILAGVDLRLPDPPLRVLASHAGTTAADLEHALSVRAQTSRATIFAARYDDLHVVLVHHRWWRAAAEVFEQREVAAGVSVQAEYAGLHAAISGARTALARTDPAHRVVSADDHQILGLLPRSEIVDLASAHLRPLSEAPDGVELRRTAETWLRHNGLYDPAARELGVHRHTVKAQVQRIQRLLDLDLDSFAGKAELWVLLQTR